MCGIAGAVGYVDDGVAEAVGRMQRQMQHRGPDDGGWWCSVGGGGAGPREAVLAHRRLAILDLSEAGAQPMVDPETGAVIVYNGEVYNFEELRRDLEAEGVRFCSHCDTEVVLHAVVRWGIRAVERFRGMFALAVWEPRRGRLHLARDRVGIKPLYLMPIEEDGRSTLLFASELRALLASGRSSRRLDREGLASCLWHGFVVGPGTMVEGVTLLPPGTCLTVEAGEPLPEPRRYWRVPPAAQDGAPAVEALREELLEAVRLRLISDVPLGVFLSGGIDSSAVAALAAEAAPGQVHTFNIGFPEAEYDESRHARAVAAGLGTEHTHLELDEAAFRAQVGDALASIDQPTFDAVNTYVVSRAVREAGMTVALAGTGGDELFGGYTSFRDLPAARSWGKRLATLPRPMVHAAAGAVGRVKTGRPGAVPPQTRWGKVRDVLAAGDDLVGLYQVSYSLFTRRFLHELSPAARSDAFGLAPRRARELAALIEDQPVLHAISTLELASFISERLMRDTDAASMAVSLEVRLPLLDHRVIEQASRVEPGRRFEPVGRKCLLRELALKRLDPAIFDRPKAGFVLPFDAWCRRGLRRGMDETFRDEALCRTVGLNPAAVVRLWEAFEAGAPGLYWSRVWVLYVLLDWCRRHGVKL